MTPAERVAEWQAQDIAAGFADADDALFDPDAPVAPRTPRMEDLQRLGDVRRIMRAANPAEGTTWLAWKAALWALGDQSRGAELTEGEVDAALWAFDHATAKRPVFQPDKPIDHEAFEMCRHLADVIRRRYA